MITIMDVGAIKDRESHLEFEVWFRSGRIGMPVCGILYGQQLATGRIWWERLAHHDAVELIGQDVSDQVAMGSISGPPREYVQFPDEGVMESVRRSRSTSPVGLPDLNGLLSKSCLVTR